jgi:hypothetical protein
VSFAAHRGGAEAARQLYEDIGGGAVRPASAVAAATESESEPLAGLGTLGRSPPECGQ